MARYSAIITTQPDDPNIPPVPIVGDSVSVIAPDGTLAALKNDDGTTLTQPVLSGIGGLLVFNVPDPGNVYTLQHRYGGRLQRVEQVIVGNPPQFQGAPGANGLPGGNILAIGPKTAATGIVVPVGTTRLDTSCYNTPGDNGQGSYTLMGADNPILAATVKFKDSLNRWWRLACLGGIAYVEQAGGAANGSSTTPTDNLQPLLDILTAIDTPLNDDPSSATFPSRFSGEVRFGVGDYYFSALFELRRTCKLQGVGSGGVGTFAYTGPTRWYFPKAQGAIIVHDWNTRGRTGAVSSDFSLGGAAGSTIDGIAFIGRGTSSDLTQHAIQVRAAGVTVSNNQFDNVAGDCVHIEGYTNGAGIYGNVNSWSVHGNWFGSSGGSSLLAAGSDANAGQEYGNNYHGAQQCGIYNTAYYANDFTPGNISGYGNNTLFHNGVLWALRSPGLGGSVEPSTNAGVWWPVFYPATNGTAWVSGGTYYLQCPIFDGGGGSVYHSPYVELSTVPAFVNAPSFVENGTLSVVGGFLGGYSQLNTSAIASQQGIGGGGGVGAMDAGYAQTGNRFFSGVGTTDAGGYIIAEQLIPGLNGDNGRWKKRVSGGCIAYYLEGDAVIGWETASKYSPDDPDAHFGGQAYVPTTMAFPQIAIGSGRKAGKSGAHRLVYYGTGAPSLGHFARGSIILNVNAAIGQPSFWQVTQTGTIGEQPWPANSAVSVGDTCTNDSGKNYVCIKTGNTAASGGPTGTGAAIADGSASWAYSTTGFVFGKSPALLALGS